MNFSLYELNFVLTLYHPILGFLRSLKKKMQLFILSEIERTYIIFYADSFALINAFFQNYVQVINYVSEKFFPPPAVRFQLAGEKGGTLNILICELLFTHCYKKQLSGKFFAVWLNNQLKSLDCVWKKRSFVFMVDT